MGNRHSGRAKTLPREQLVRRRASRFGRMKAQPQPLGRLRGDARGPVADSEDSVKESACRQRLDALVRVLETYRSGIVSPGILQDVAAVGRQDQLDVEQAGCLGKLAHL